MKKYALLLLLIGSFAVTQTARAQEAAPTPREAIGRFGVINGKAKNLVKPVYPPLAAKSGADGVVSVKVTVDEKGNVISAVAESGNTALYEAAVTAAKQSTFVPFMFGGKARKMTGSVVYNFVAQKPKNDETLDFAAISELADFLNRDKTNKALDIFKVPDMLENAKYDDAIKILDGYIQTDPKQDLTRAYRATALYYKGEYQKAMVDIEAALATNPNQTMALNIRGLIHRKRLEFDVARKDFDSAIAISNKAIAARPGSMDDYFNRAETYRLRGDNEKAAADYRKTLELTPGYRFAKKHLDLVNANADTPEPQEVIDVMNNLAEFERLKPLYDAAATRLDKQEAAIKAANLKNHHTPFTKPADNTGVCSVLSEMDSIYNKLFNEVYEMTTSKDAGDLEDRPDLEMEVDDANAAMEEKGGDILTKQMIWGCKTK